MLLLTSADLYVRSRSPGRDHDDSVTTPGRADQVFARHFLRHRLDVGIVTGKAADDGGERAAPRTMARWRFGPPYNAPMFTWAVVLRSHSV